MRALFLDRDLHRVNNQLNQTIDLLAEYQRILQSSSELQVNAIKALLEEDRRIRKQEEKEKVEPDFLGLLWASLAFALALGGFAAKKVPLLSIDSPFNVVSIVWLFLAFGSLIFLFINGLFAIRLTRQYAESKSDRGYKLYASFLWTGMIVIVVCAMILYLAGFSLSSFSVGK